MNGPSRSYYALGFFGLGYFVSEAVRIYYRRRQPRKQITSVCDEWALTLETARELDEMGGGARADEDGPPRSREEQNSRLASLSEMALATVAETARAVRELGGLGDDGSRATQLTRLCDLALQSVNLTAKRIAANALAEPPDRLAADRTPPRRSAKARRSLSACEDLDSARSRAVDLNVLEDDDVAPTERLIATLHDRVSSDLESLAPSSPWATTLRELESSSDSDDEDDARS